MKKCLFGIICLLLSSTFCNAQYLDEISVKLHQPSDLKNDVSLVQTTLEKENPNLYLYISKKKLSHQFDSLRNTIKEPLTSIALYVKLLGVISGIGDGHLTLNIDVSKLTPSDVAYLKKPLPQHPIYQFGYCVIANRLHISENFSIDPTLTEGTEILSINGVPVAKLIDSLNQYITSDGYNTTFKKFLMNERGLFSERYRFLYPKKEPLNFELQSEKGSRKITLNVFQKSGYDTSGLVQPASTAYKLLTADSNIAYLQLRSFFNVDKTKGYHSYFKDIKARGLKTLIIDLRGNTGGETGWAASVYSYLIDTPTYFYRLPSEISRQKLLYDNPKIKDWVKGASHLKYPIVTPDTNGFKGKVYVLINGGSFSATSLLAANLRNLKNVIFVGEETGGSKNVWTAGYLKKITLPTSKLLLEYGVIPAYFGDLSTLDGHGLMPDIPISYSIEDYLAKKDLELEWVLKDIAGKNMK